MNNASKIYNHKLPNNVYGISPMRSDGNPPVKIEGGGGQQRYLYTIKMENFRQILMSSLTHMHCKQSITNHGDLLTSK